MKYTKKRLISLAKQVEQKKPLTPKEISYLLSFEKLSKNNSFLTILKHLAVPASFVAGFILATFSDFFANLAASLPPWTNLHPQLLAGVDYFWDFLGEPIAKPNIIYHIPNIVLYTFGVAELRTLIDSIEQRTWLKRVTNAQDVIRDNINTGQLNLEMKDGHSLLFVGGGDFIGKQFTLNNEEDATVTISLKKPNYTRFWNHYDVSTLYDDLKEVIMRSSGKNAGEYVFFPVKDDQIFLPNDTAYDLSPHKLDIICQNIRNIEKEMGLTPRRIFIIGDKFHKSSVHSEDKKKIIGDSQDIISLETISNKYKNVTLLDPTDIVLNKIIKLAKGRKIVFRATEAGIAEYKARFYDRLEELGYEDPKDSKGVLTIGYDMFEDQTEQQTLAGKINDYVPVVLSKDVCDALLRNGYKKTEFIYVPDLVLKELTQEASEQ